MVHVKYACEGSLWVSEWSKASNRMIYCVCEILTESWLYRRWVWSDVTKCNLFTKVLPPGNVKSPIELGAWGPTARLRFRNLGWQAQCSQPGNCSCTLWIRALFANKSNISKYRLLHWVVDAIALAYESVGVAAPSVVICHSTSSVSWSWHLQLA